MHDVIDFTEYDRTSKQDNYLISIIINIHT